MKKIFLILIVFIFIYPIFLNFLPIPLDRILQFLGFIVLIMYPKDLKEILQKKVVLKFYGITTILLLLTFLALFQNYQTSDSYFFKEILNTFFYLFSSYLICWQMKKTYNHIDIRILIYYIVLAALLQTIISFIFFFNNSIFHSYLSLLKAETIQGLLDRTNLIGKRFIGLGSNFFTGVLKYGVAFLCVLILPYIYNCRLTNNKLIYWLSVLFIVVGGLLTGRTFFFAILLGILMYLFYSSTNIISFISNNIRVLIIIILSAFVLFLFATLFIDGEKLNNIFNFVFEMFINFFEEDSLETASTNRMEEMVIFPDNELTWLFGDGRMVGNNGIGYYMRTDLGFIRLLFYFGLPSTLFFIYVFYKYYKLLVKYLNNKAIKFLIFFITLWLLLLNAKGLSSDTKYFVLFLITISLSNNKSKEYLKW